MPQERGPWRPGPEAYRYTPTLSPSGWAWEFLRRNSTFRREAFEHRRRDVPTRRDSVIACRQDDGTMWLLGMRRIEAAERWGLEVFPNPDRNGVEAAPFWLPDLIGGDIEAMMEPPAGLGCDLFSVSNVPKRKTVLIRLGERVRMAVDGSGYCETLAAAAPAEPPSGDIQVGLAVCGERQFGSHMDRLRSFVDYCRGPASGLRRVPASSSQRLTDILIALDGKRSGCSYREIAHAFYEADQIADDWTGSGSMKLRMRRLVTRGENLMRSCYRTLLAPRPNRGGQALG